MSVFKKAVLSYAENNFGVYEMQTEVYHWMLMWRDVYTKVTA